jgi:hypothetical protein
MQVPDDEKLKIFTAIENNRSWDLFRGSDNHRSNRSLQLLSLEDEGNIKINGKTIYEGKYLDYISLEITEPGMELYKWLKE